MALMAPRAEAWNSAGHRIIAGMVYDQLTPSARLRADELIRRHPDYTTIFLREAAGDDAAKARWAFMMASTWPDVIRGNPRFYDDMLPDDSRSAMLPAATTPTPTLPGFPDMKRHVPWHFYSIPFSPDGTKLEPIASPNALTEMRRLITEIGGGVKGADPVYDLPWLLHIASDVHNPVHAASRFVKAMPQGDFIATRVIVSGGTILHAVWDSALGVDAAPEPVNRSAQEYAAEFARSSKTGARELDPKKWIDESFALAKGEAYTFGLAVGSAEQPVMLDAAYLEKAGRISRQRAGLAAARIAAILNRKLK